MQCEHDTLNRNKDVDGLYECAKPVCGEEFQLTPDN